MKRFGVFAGCIFTFPKCILYRVDILGFSVGVTRIIQWNSIEHEYSLVLVNTASQIIGNLVYDCFSLPAHLWVAHGSTWNIVVGLLWLRYWSPGYNLYISPSYLRLEQIESPFPEYIHCGRWKSLIECR